MIKIYNNITRSIFLLKRKLTKEVLKPRISHVSFHLSKRFCRNKMNVTQRKKNNNNNVRKFCHRETSTFFSWVNKKVKLKLESVRVVWNIIIIKCKGKIFSRNKTLQKCAKFTLLKITIEMISRTIIIHYRAYVLLNRRYFTN